MIPPRLAEFGARIGFTGIAIAVLLLIVAVQTIRIEGFKIWPLSMKGYKAEVAELEAANENCEDRVTASNKSIATLEAVIADLNEQAEQRAEAFAEAQELAKERNRELARLAKSSNAKIERLRRIAERGADEECRVPADLARELEGL